MNAIITMQLNIRAGQLYDIIIIVKVANYRDSDSAIYSVIEVVGSHILSKSEVSTL